ncbi:hypothetical protein HS99_0040080 [Kitasatospora aureofaciens]|uniref:Uncharacterized protein n=1 Tax=Kitasatospora aureofaciens TaxID=1894 RepID=A0A1E7MVW3_KITAU|nr:hypothetical protein HS99_0040080 [Kitasatospora aureofaciens]
MAPAQPRRGDPGARAADHRDRHRGRGPRAGHPLDGPDRPAALAGGGHHGGRAAEPRRVGVLLGGSIVDALVGVLIGTGRGAVGHGHGFAFVFVDAEPYGRAVPVGFGRAAVLRTADRYGGALADADGRRVDAPDRGGHGLGTIGGPGRRRAAGRRQVRWIGGTW